MNKYTIVNISKRVRIFRGPEPKRFRRAAVRDCLWMDAFLRGYLLYDLKNNKEYPFNLGYK